MSTSAACRALWLAGAAATLAQSGCDLREPADTSAYVIARTEQFVLRSDEERSYRVSIARPQEPAPAEGYPVIYVLDPASAFATLVETVRNQEMFYGPAVVVGVGYPMDANGDASGEAYGRERMRDMTPPTDRSTLPANNLGEPWGELGSADAFLGFMLAELKNAVEARVPVDRGRQALFGHSLGGLFVLHTLFTRPESFQTYVAGSPSVWWGGKSILAEAQAYRDRQPQAAQRRLLITVGGFESQVRPEEEAALAKIFKSADLEQMKRRYREYVADVAVIANCRELFELLTEPGSPALEVGYVEFPAETHNSVIPAYLSRGATFTLAPDPPR